MTHKLFLMLGAGLALAACQPEEGVGFTGIGTASQSSYGGYALDFQGLVPVTTGAERSRTDGKDAR